MASIFTYEPDPPQLTSPWPAPRNELQRTDSSKNELLDNKGQSCLNGLQPTPLIEAAVTRLEPEPQEGPTEYKLHLLLRPRRSYSSVSTGTSISGSQQHIRSPSLTPRSVSESNLGATPPVAQSVAARQHRLEQLTTQLLWRLQQSSPYHSSSANNVILPALPDNDCDLQELRRPAKLVPGLEESRGALYEIGVSDDGTFVGLTVDELNESVQNLRAMAASLGCSVEILRLVNVGNCEWYEEGVVPGEKWITKKADLFVAEAYVKPELRQTDADAATSNGEKLHTVAGSYPSAEPRRTSVEQLRVSLTGATTSGKSSLLGTLSTSTLDNGRGRSRLSLLRHRHEIASGLTSSVAQELIGYRDITETQDAMQCRVVNYASENAMSWSDMHVVPGLSRLVFLTDSAGHLRFRRTTVRGLLSWNPHWTLLCVAGGEGVDPQQGLSKPSEEFVFPGANAHISMAHLDLCLKLQLPLVLIITKLDIATKSDIRQILSTMLTSLKEAGRKPVIVPNDSGVIDESDLRIVKEHDLKVVENVFASFGNLFEAVPIIFTSAASGTGISRFHALLRRLPIPRTAVTHGSDEALFQIDHTYEFTPARSIGLAQANTGGTATILSGYLAHGRITIGQDLYIGPFSEGRRSSVEDADVTPASFQNDMFLTPRSFSDALARATTPPTPKTARLREWRSVRVVSIRNLRSPVRALEADQVGTIGVTDADSTPLTVRKGMILTTRRTPEASHSFTAAFDIAEAQVLSVGSLLVVYCASVRASAKVVAVALDERRHSSDEGDDFMFALDEDDGQRHSASQTILVTCRFITHKEYLETDGRVLVMPGGGAVGSGEKGVGGLESIVGQITQTFG